MGVWQTPSILPAFRGSETQNLDLLLSIFSLNTTESKCLTLTFPFYNIYVVKPFRAQESHGETISDQWA